MSEAPTHRSVLAALPAERLAALNERQNAPGLIHLAGHLGLILGTGALIALRVPGWPLLLPLQGVFLCFLFALAHEATHRTPFADDRLSDWAGRLAGLPILLPFEWFRYFHLAHHRHTQDPDRDPELLSGAKPASAAAYALHVSGLPYWAGQARQVWQNALGRAAAPWLPPRALPRIRREARWMLALYALAAASLFATPLLVWVWIVPVLLGQPVLRLYLLAEHGRCAFVANMLENTRTTLTNRAVRFLAWNMPFHTEHHSAPTVPFHRLPDLHREMKASLQVTAPGYAAFTRDYVQHLKG
jgi:fatty acid desaturase